MQEQLYGARVERRKEFLWNYVLVQDDFHAIVLCDLWDLFWIGHHEEYLSQPRCAFPQRIQAKFNQIVGRESVLVVGVFVFGKFIGFLQPLLGGKKRFLPHGVVHIHIGYYCVNIEVPVHNSPRLFTMLI